MSCLLLVEITLALPLHPYLEHAQKCKLLKKSLVLLHHTFPPRYGRYNHRPANYELCTGNTITCTNAARYDKKFNGLIDIC